MHNKDSSTTHQGLFPCNKKTPQQKRPIEAQEPSNKDVCMTQAVSLYKDHPTVRKGPQMQDKGLFLCTTMHNKEPPTGCSYTTVLTGECDSYVVEQEPGTRNQERLLEGLTFTLLTQHNTTSFQHSERRFRKQNCPLDVTKCGPEPGIL